MHSSFNFYCNIRGGVKCESKVKYGLMFCGAGEKERKVDSENDGVLGNHVVLSPDFTQWSWEMGWKGCVCFPLWA